MKQSTIMSFALSLHLLSTTNAFIPISTRKEKNIFRKRIFDSASISKNTRIFNLNPQTTATETNDTMFLQTNIPETLWEKVATNIVDAVSYNSEDDSDVLPLKRERLKYQTATLLRVSAPSLLIGVAAFLSFPFLSSTIASMINDKGVLYVLSNDYSQFIQNTDIAVGYLFSMLVGQTYFFMYQQQESLYYALFNEVTEAKSLLEQVALVCRGRSMYPQVLDSIYRYVRDDLKQLQTDPAILLSRRPVDDPLESIMYMTSVGVPGSVYDTVRSLRRARAERLGALQRKLPEIHLWLLWFLAAMELMTYPVLGAGVETLGGYNILTVQGVLFGIMTTCIFIAMGIVKELWRPAGGAYNVDTVLSVMIRGLDEELRKRMRGRQVYGSQALYPTAEKTVYSVGPPLTMELFGLQNKTFEGNA